MKLSTNDIWMIIVCALPLLLIFIAPAFGINDKKSVLIFLIAMFVVHLFMPTHSHSNNHDESMKQQSNKETSKTNNHE